MYSVGGKPLNPTDPATPCGLVARSFFTDTYVLFKLDSQGNRVQPAVTINETDIAWESDVKYKFRNVYEDLPAGLNWTDVQWIDMENEHFIVWMRTAGLPNFRKLWGRVEEDMTPGTYELVIYNQYDVSLFEG
mmetsp:Transcript_22343/g.16809  ORF Transcript_22343/g.16809 Transcript_22343/m.16809 type:complete len:133 (+) Transcript_22343:452-850(+)